MPERLSNEELLWIADNGRRDLLKLLTDDDLSQLDGAMRERDMVKRETIKRPGAIQRKARVNLMRTRSEEYPGLPPRPQDKMQQYAQPNPAMDKFMAGGPMGMPSPSSNIQADTQLPKQIRQRQQEYGMEGGLVIPPITKEEAGGSAALQTLGNIPVGLANFVGGGAQMVGHAAQVAGHNIAGAAADASMRLGMGIPGAGTFSEEQFRKSAEAMTTLVDEVSGLTEAMVDIPAAVVNSALYTMLPPMQPTFNKYGITNEKLGQYLTHDPVGTVLFALPWVKSGIKTSANVKAGTTFDPTVPRREGVLTKPPTATTDRGTYLRSSDKTFPGRLVQFHKFEDAPFPEAIFVMDEPVTIGKVQVDAGQAVRARDLINDGFQIPVAWERRMVERTTMERLQFASTTEELFAKWRDDNPNATPEQLRDAQTEIIEAQRERTRASRDAEYRAKLEAYEEWVSRDPKLAEYGIDAASMRQGVVEDFAFIDMISEQRRKYIEAERTENGLPNDPKEIANRIGQLEDRTQRALDVLNKLGDDDLSTTAIVDEMQLVDPRMSRKEIMDALAKDRQGILKRIAVGRAVLSKDVAKPIQVPASDVPANKMKAVEEAAGRIKEAQETAGLLEGSVRATAERIQAEEIATDTIPDVDEAVAKARAPVSRAPQPVDFDTVTFAEFGNGLARARATERGYNLEPLMMQDAEGAQFFMTKDRTAGIAVFPDGKMGNAFNVGEQRGIIGSLLRKAEENGGQWGDAYEGDLTNLYRKHGYEPVARLPFDPELAPDGIEGTPDVIFVAKAKPGTDVVTVANYDQGASVAKTVAKETRTTKVDPKSAKPRPTGKVMSILEEAETAATNRLKAKLQGKVAGDITAIIGESMADLAIIGAAKIARGVKTFAGFSREMVSEYGPKIKPYLGKLWMQAQKRYKTILNDADLPSVKRLADLLEKGEPGGEWYGKALEEVSEYFGPDAELFIDFFAATSARTSVRANMKFAVEAYHRYKTGQPMRGFMKAHRLNLERVVRGEPIKGPKVGPFADALKGDHNAVVVDRWMMRAFGIKGDSPTEAQVKLITRLVREKAAQRGISPRMYQETLWKGIKRESEEGGGARHTAAPFKEVLREAQTQRTGDLFATQREAADRADASREWIEDPDRFVGDQSPLRTTQWTILTAENPQGQAISPKENAVRNQRLKAELEEAGFHPIEVEGSYGMRENSFIVPGMDEATALDYIRRYDQESAATTRGLVNQNGQINPADLNNIDFSGTQPDYYTEIRVGDKTVRFTIPIEFDRTVPTRGTTLKTSTDILLGETQANATRQALGSIFGIPSDSPQVSDTMGWLGNVMQAAVDSALGTSPALKSLLRQDPSYYNLVEQYLSARTNSQVMGKLWFDDMMRIFSEEGNLKKNSAVVTKRAIDFARFLNSEKAKAIKMRNAADQARYESLRLKADELNRRFAMGEDIPRNEWLSKSEQEFMARHERAMKEGIPEVTIPEMAVEEERAFLMDPTTEGALAYWKDIAQPFIESMAEGAGIGTRIQGQPVPVGVGDVTTNAGGLYAKTVWYNDPSVIKSSTKWFDTRSRARGVGPGGGPWKYTRTKARAARQAKGAAPEGYILSEDLRDIIDQTLTDRLTAYSKRQMQEALVSYDYSNVEGAKTGEMVDFNGNQVRLVNYQLDFPGGPAGKQILGKFRGTMRIDRVNVLVPEPLAKAYEFAVNKDYIGQRLPALDKASRWITGMALIVPAEASMHGLGVLHALASVPKVGSQTRLGRIIAQAGMPGRTLAAISDMWSLEGESFRQDVLTLSKGALRTSHFDHGLSGMETQSVVAKIGELPVLRHLKDYVFGMPSLGKGLNGLETRARVAMLRALRHGDPKISNAEARHLINNQMGTYLNKLEPAITKAMKPIDPFARAGTALIKTGIKSTAGFGPKGWSPELAINVITTGIMIALFNKWLDPEGRWPWESAPGKVGNRGLKPGDIAIPTESGKRYDIPFRVIANNMYRAINLTGMRTAYEAYINDQQDIEWVFVEQLRGVYNALLGRMGPPARIVRAALTGQAPYQLPGGGFLPVEQPSTNDPIMRRLQAVMKAVVPIAGKTIEAYGEIGAADPTGLIPESHRYAHPDTTFGRATYYLAKLFGAEPSIRPDGYETKMGGAGSRGRKARLDKVVWSLYYESQNIPQEKLGPWLQRELPSRVQKDELVYAFQKFFTLQQRMPERYIESQVEQDLYNQGMGAPYGMVGN